MNIHIIISTGFVLCKNTKLDGMLNSKMFMFLRVKSF